MINETQFVVDSFAKNFTRYKEVPMVIYGLGKNTQVVLNELPNFNVVGLMDEVRTGETIFDKMVITCEEALLLGVRVIVIVARASNVPIIYRRISDFCKENNIEVFDINGIKQSLENEEWSRLPEIYTNIEEEKLKDLIDKSDVVSFDIFDTMLMRTSLTPRDVFQSVEEILIEKYGIELAGGYAKARIKSEQDLYLIKQPNIQEIYIEINKSFKLNSEILNDWMSEEINQELKCLIARKKMIDIFSYTKGKGKAICITSDMYFSSKILKKFLEQNGYLINDIPIFVSNEQGVAKYNGLFEILRTKYGKKRILHIGDNEEADIRASQIAGIDNSFYIKSAYDMLTDSVANDLINHAGLLANRNYIGRFIAKQFNNPFVFEHTKGKLSLCSEYDMGYSFLTPIVTVFVNWLIDMCKKEEIGTLLLGARDGYLIEKLLNIVKELDSDVNLPMYKYFYASRSVCLIAGLRNDDDINYAASLAFAGNVKELLMRRFGLKEYELQNEIEEETEVEYILRHRDDIFSFANDVKKNYLKYINKQEIDVNKKIGFFDFVSSGTCQMAMEQFMEWENVGFYFARLYDEHKEKLKIRALCPETSVYENQLAIISKYFFMENVFTSFEPTLVAFDDDGEPVFGKENRSESQLESLKIIQNGILDGFKDLLSQNSKFASFDLYFADTLIKYIDSQYTKLELSYFADNPLVDEFCNRSFNLMEM
ncbi:HAD-IA family hydrolase [Clostridium sp. KNHs205]|uniref:HAD-IA family hydrolase n=1 Tax=Clostridium sp. KNHs205 TaxID=1449050 RepID=UPI00051AAD71|nr:HAD-IA family hydrolase [Clostridium sp. KNHs205]